MISPVHLILLCYCIYRDERYDLTPYICIDLIVPIPQVLIIFRNYPIVFKKALLYGGSISAMCMAGLILFGKQVVLLLFGQRYADAIALMVPVGCFILPLTFITILMNYLTALGNAHFLAATLGGGFVMIVILVGFFHETAAQMLYIMGGVLAVVTIANLVKVFCFDTRHTET